MGGMAAATRSLGRAIKDARERRHLTQQQLADVLGVDRKTVDNWENERTIPRNRMGALVQWAPELGGTDEDVYTDPAEARIWSWEDTPPERRRQMIEELRAAKRADRRTA